MADDKPNVTVIYQPAKPSAGIVRQVIGELFWFLVVAGAIFWISKWFAN